MIGYAPFLGQVAIRGIRHGRKLLGQTAEEINTDYQRYKTAFSNFVRRWEALPDKYRPSLFYCEGRVNLLGAILENAPLSPEDLSRASGVGNQAAHCVNALENEFRLAEQAWANEQRAIVAESRAAAPISPTPTNGSPSQEAYACPEPGGLYTVIQPKDGMHIRGQRPGPGVIPLPASDKLCVQYAQPSIPGWAWGVGGLAAAGLFGWLIFGR